MIPGVHCSTCVYFAPPPFTARGRVEYGQCRRYGPQLDHTTEKRRTIWPLVASNAWCGEHAVPDDG